MSRPLAARAGLAVLLALFSCPRAVLSQAVNADSRVQNLGQAFLSAQPLERVKPSAGQEAVLSAAREVQRGPSPGESPDSYDKRVRSAARGLGLGPDGEQTAVDVYVRAHLMPASVRGGADDVVDAAARNARSSLAAARLASGLGSGFGPQALASAAMPVPAVAGNPTPSPAPGAVPTGTARFLLDGSNAAPPPPVAALPPIGAWASGVKRGYVAYSADQNVVDLNMAVLEAQRGSDCARALTSACAVNTAWQGAGYIKTALNSIGISLTEKAEPLHQAGVAAHLMWDLSPAGGVQSIGTQIYDQGPAFFGERTNYLFMAMAVLPFTRTASEATRLANAAREGNATLSQTGRLASVVAADAFGGAAASDALSRRAVAVSAQDFPGGSGGVLRSGREYRALMTKDILVSELPYAATLREPGAISLPSSLGEAARAPVRAATDIAFASAEHSGSGGLVRLAYLADGRPVAVKAYHLSRQMSAGEVEALVLEEARSAKLLSDLGIGPKFHGVWKDPEGRMNVVFDIARGDFRGTPVNAATFRDLESIIGRLRGAGIRDYGDMQLFRSPEGRLMVIDPGSAAHGYGAAPSAARGATGEVMGFATEARIEQLSGASTELGRQYLRALHNHSYEAFAGLWRRVMTSSSSTAQELRATYPDIFRLNAS